MVVFTSEEAHYSVHKMSALLGIGESNVIEIKTDEIGRMIPDDLERQINHHMSLNRIPLAVVITLGKSLKSSETAYINFNLILGTTIRGGFDPIEPIAAICQKYDIWLHADAAWGGGLLFSKTHKYLLQGLEKTNSVAINPHKLLCVPQQCSILLVKNGKIIKDCHSREAQYLFQKDKFYDAYYDCGDKYFQCGRKCDIFKFWLMWKAKGNLGFEKHVDAILETSKYLTERIEEKEDFQLVSKPQFINVCFWYIPKSLKSYEVNGNYSKKLHMVSYFEKQKKL